MRLIKISATASDIGPVDRLLRTNEPQHLLKAPNAAKEFRRQPDFAPELFDELLVAHPEIMRNGCNALQMRFAHEFPNGPGDAPVSGRLGAGGSQSLAEHLFKDPELGLRAWRRQESLPPT